MHEIGAGGQHVLMTLWQKNEQMRSTRLEIITSFWLASRNF